MFVLKLNRTSTVFLLKSDKLNSVGVEIFDVSSVKLEISFVSLHMGIILYVFTPQRY